MEKRALTIARFEPPTKGHFNVIDQIKSDGYKEIIIGIGSAEMAYTLKNPFTCGERMNMLHSVLKDYGFEHYFLVPIRDVHDNDLWVAHVARLVPEFEKVYGGNPLLIELFKRAGYEVVETKRLTFRDFRKNPPEDIVLSATEVREMIFHDDKLWKELVPDQVYKRILEIKGNERIKRLYSMKM